MKRREGAQLTDAVEDGVIDDDRLGEVGTAVDDPVADGAERHLVEDEPARFFRPPYVGARGWVGMWLDDEPDWDRVELLVEEAWRCIAGPRLIKEWATRR